MNFSHLKEYNC